MAIKEDLDVTDYLIFALIYNYLSPTSYPTINQFKKDTAIIINLNCSHMSNYFSHFLCNHQSFRKKATLNYVYYYDSLTNNHSGHNHNFFKYKLYYPVTYDLTW